MPAISSTTCDIYRKSISELRESGDLDSLAAMIETWYTRCGFKTCFDGCELLDAGIHPNGLLWLKTSRGTLEFCSERDRWRLVEGQGDPLYMMARIAEVTQVPFAYLCGLRDAVVVIESNATTGLSERLRRLRKEYREITSDLNRKRIAVDAVFASVDGNAADVDLSSSRYPDAPNGLLSWDQLRSAYRSTPGVYFAWCGGRIVYVGATEKGMHSRLQNKHHAVTRDDLFSFVQVPVNEVFFAECCYIARYVPQRNACVAQACGRRQGGQRGKRKQPAPA